VPHRHASFVHLENIKNFEKQLETETDPARRELLFKLLAEEKAGTLLSYADPKP